MTSQQIQSQIEARTRKAETGADWAVICDLEAQRLAAVDKERVAQFFIRKVYGVSKIYPANEVARKFAALLCVKTFNVLQIEDIKGLGFRSEQVMDPSAVANLACPSGWAIDTSVAS